MSFARAFWDLIAWTIPSKPCANGQEKTPRILVIRRNRMGDMICTLPLLRALRRYFPEGHLAVACDSPGVPIAKACEGIDEVILLPLGWNRWQTIFKAAARLQGYDWVLATKGGFDQRLAALTRLTNGVRRVGYEKITESPSVYYTDSVEIPHNLWEIHQIETALRLLQPMDIPLPEDPVADLQLNFPPSALEFASKIGGQPPFSTAARFLLINLSSTAPLKFSKDDFVDLITKVLTTTDFTIGLVGAPRDQKSAEQMTQQLASPRVVVVATPGPLELAALLQRAAFFLTSEGGAAHLAATTQTPTLILWSAGPFEKWYSRGIGHAFVQLEPGESSLPRERVWLALQPYLALPAR